jgi:hypothetical protein
MYVAYTAKARCSCPPECYPGSREMDGTQTARLDPGANSDDDVGEPSAAYVGT